jgi:hypothetical protein
MSLPMNLSWRNFKFTTNLVHDDREGWSALELRRRSDAESKVVARIVFWDAEASVDTQNRPMIDT